MIVNIDTLIFNFILFSMGGWLLEVIYRSISNRRFINPGFNKGPYVPLYGIASAFIILTYSLIQDQPLYIRALIYLAVTTILEYITGEVLLVVFKRRCWDYRNNFLNLRGHICPSFSLAWVIASFVFEYTLYPLSSMIISLMQVETIRTINVVFLMILTADFYNSSGLRVRALITGRQMLDILSEKIEIFTEVMDNLSSSKKSLQGTKRQLVKLYAANIADIDTFIRKTRHRIDGIRQKIDRRTYRY